MTRPLLAALAATAALSATSALACTPAPGYRVPTNLELAAQADSIVLARVVGEVRGDEEAWPDENALIFRPLAAVKGLLPGQDFPIHGMVYAEGELDEFAEPSDPLDLQYAHPAAEAGACIRFIFAPGAQVLLFLDRREGEWVPAGRAFSRWAEDVDGESAPWFQLTQFYTRIAALPADQRTALLEAERDALLARVDDPAAQAMGADVARQLEGPNKPLREDLPPVPDEEPDDVQRAIDALAAD